MFDDMYFVEYDPTDDEIYYTKKPFEVPYTYGIRRNKNFVGVYSSKQLSLVETDNIEVKTEEGGVFFSKLFGVPLITGEDSLSDSTMARIGYRMQKMYSAGHCAGAVHGRDELKREFHKLMQR